MTDLFPEQFGAGGAVDLDWLAARTVVKSLTLSLDTNAYAAGDVLADTQELASALRVGGGGGVLHSIQVIDQDDQGLEMDIFIFNATATLGTENAAISISDADAAKILGIVRIYASDYIDCINSMVASRNGLNIPLKIATGTSIYIAAATRGAPTHSASGVVLNIGILQD